MNRSYFAYQIDKVEHPTGKSHDRDDEGVSENIHSANFETYKRARSK